VKHRVSDRLRRQLRETFGEVPELYDRARPVYPTALLADLVELAELPAGGRILEIGPGTGQATLPLAERGFRITGIELSEGLASVARRKLLSFPDVEIICEPFETWAPVSASFDAVVAFTAFHWIDHDVRFTKPAELLRSGGALALVATSHVRVPGSDEFWADVQEDYDAIDPSDDNAPPPDPDDVGDLSDEIAASGLFENIASRRYLWDVVYSADEYIDVLDTYSGHRRIEPGKRHHLYDAIHRRIEARPGGRVTKTYLATLNIARISTGAGPAVSR
jgi:SAM-dependent methyltransferase